MVEQNNIMAWWLYDSSHGELTPGTWHHLGRWLNYELPYQLPRRRIRFVHKTSLHSLLLYFFPIFIFIIRCSTFKPYRLCPSDILAKNYNVLLVLELATELLIFFLKGNNFFHWNETKAQGTIIGKIWME